MENSNITRDPSTADARLYIGALPEVVNRLELDTHFNKFGNVLAFSLNKGFGFVQYEKAEFAQAAYKAMPPMMQGRRIVVRPAVNSSWANDIVRFSDEQNDKQSSFAPKIWNTGAGAGMANNRPNMPNNMNRQNRQNSFEPTNDCEIIVLSRLLTNYAESIENRLRQAGLTVDLLFPNSEVPLGKVLASISGRGCLYAILVTPLNEEHRSITVNILYGQPAEHRNMPVDDAIMFIQNNFTAYKSSNMNRPVVLETTSTGNRHTDAIQQLIHVLAENRPLTVLQYDTIIQYLQERRESQIKDELGDAAATMMPDKSEEQKLQEKILSILEKPSFTENMMSIEVEETSATLSNGLEILLDSKVQRALDSLLNSCIGWK